MILVILKSIIFFIKSQALFFVVVPTYRINLVSKKEIIHETINNTNNARNDGGCFTVGWHTIRTPSVDIEYTCNT